MRMTLIQDIICLKLFNNSQLLAPPEWLNDLLCFCEYLCSNYCVLTTNEQPCTQLAIVQELLGERTGLVVRASDSGSGDPGSILGRIGVLFP